MRHKRQKVIDMLNRICMRDRNRQAASKAAFLSTKAPGMIEQHGNA